MSTLARPGVCAALLAAAGFALHPATGAWLPGRPALLASALALVALALLSRAALTHDGRLAAALTAVGATGLVAALGADGLRGHHGTLVLAAGQSASSFDEVGPEGRPLGLRPLGFAVGAGRVAPDGSVALVLPGHDAPLDLTPHRAVAFGGYRFAAGRTLAPTGGVARLRVSASDGARTTTVDVAPGEPGRAGDLTIALEQYFPDFALDDRQQPFSRSAEPRNPAALLTVERGGQSYRAFVLRSMPGVHRVEGLGLAFSLLEIDPERPVEVAVHREPAAPVALASALLLVLGLGLTRRPRAAPPAGGGARPASNPALVAGAALAAFLALVDGSSVLAWSFGLPAASGRVGLPGVGVLLGAALVLALGGSLLLLAEGLAGEGGGTARVARGGLWGAAALGTGGLVLAVGRLLALPGSAEVVGRPLVGLAGALGVLAVALVAGRPSASGRPARLAAAALAAAAWATCAAAIAVAFASVLRQGTYATGATEATAAASLLGLAALEPTGVSGPRRLAFLLALLALAFA